MLESRTILLGEDGRHVILGCRTWPSEEEIASVAEALVRQGMGGWLAAMTGFRSTRRGKVRVEALREVAQPRASFPEALERFRAARKGATTRKN